MTLDTRVIAAEPGPPVLGKIRRASVGGLRSNPDNCARQRAALDRMDECERICGFSREQIEAFHAEQRARVLGLPPADDAPGMEAA